MSSIMREDWIECELGEMSKSIQYGYTESSSNKPIGPKFLRITDIQNNNVNWSTVPYCNISNDKITNYLLEKGDLLFARTGATVGKSFLIKNEIPESVFASYLIRVRVNNIVLDRFFLSYFFNSPFYWQQITEGQVGIGQPNVNGTKLGKLTIPLAPLPIQRAIVSKIEALFSDLDNGIANFKKAQEQLKIYRQAVLKKAFEGGYSLNYDSNDEQENYDLIDENKKNHSNQKINSNHSSDNLPMGWKWVNSGEFFSFVTSGSRGWAKYYSESGSIFIRITNLNFDTLSLDLRDEKIQYVTPPQNSEGLRTKVEEGDFLFSITGYLGMFAIAPKLESAFVNQHVSLCRPKDFFDKKYLAYWIIAKSGGHYHLNKNQKGAVKAGLNLDDLKTFPVPLPPTIQEQTQIVQEIESRLSVCDKMEQSINESIAKAEALRQSILKKAFEGRLLSEVEVELCKKEADYEPASELLKKIQAEKAERITKNKSKK